LFWQFGSSRAARQGKWKIVADGDKSPWELYDLETDRTELNNLAQERPERVETLAALWNEWAKRVGAKAPKEENPGK
jgi:arylsulfatase